MADHPGYMQPKISNHLRLFTLPLRSHEAPLRAGRFCTGLTNGPSGEVGAAASGAAVLDLTARATRRKTLFYKGLDENSMAISGPF
jgi:hypothetical protein